MKLLKRPMIRPPAAKPRPKVTKLNVSASRAASRAELEDYDDYEDDVREPNMRLTHAFIVVIILHVIAVGGVFGYNAMKTRQAANAKAASAAAAEKPVPAAPEPIVEKTAAVPAPAPVAAAPVKPAVAPAPVAKIETRDIIPGPTAPAAPATPARAAAPGTYEVMPGDTLIRIASRNGTTVEALEKANGLATGAVLKVGQALRLPSSAKTASPVAPAPAVAKTETPAASPKAETAKPAPAPAAAAPASATQDSGEVYVIAKGDNPYSIAKKLKVSYQKLIEINGITDPTKLQIGQQIKIPAN